MFLGSENAIRVSLSTGDRVFFSKFLMGGLKIFGPRPTGTKSDGGGDLRKKIRLKPKLPI